MEAKFKGLLRALVEAHVKASPAYMRKEAVRQRLQDIITDAVSAGDVADANDLDKLVGAMEMSLQALRLVPIDVWRSVK